MIKILYIQSMNLTLLRNKKRLFFYFCMLSATGCLFSCDNENRTISDKKGNLVVTLEANTDYPAGIILKSTDTKAGNFGDFDPENYAAYQILIKKGENTVKSCTYADMPETQILQEGNYKLVAALGNLLPAAFEQPYFAGNAEFVIKDSELTPISVKTELANTKIAVNYSDAFLETFETYEVAMSTEYMEGDSLYFAKGETRAAYFQSVQAGTRLSICVKVKPLGKDTWMEAKQTTTVKPKEFVRFNFKTDTEDRAGHINAEITIDSTTTDIPLELKLPGIYLPVERPAIELMTENGQSSVTTTEGVAQDMVANVKAPGGLGNCLFYINTPVEGLETLYDLRNLTDAEKTFLETKGLRTENMDNPVGGVSSVNLTNFIGSLTAGTEETASYEFALVARDQSPIAGVSDSLLIHVEVGAPSFRMTMTEGDAWAKKVTLRAAVDNGNVNKISGFKYKTASGSEQFAAATVVGEEAVATVTGLSASTPYTAYAVYGSHTSETAAFTTEAETPLVNGNMESWHSKAGRTNNWNYQYPWTENDESTYGWNTLNPKTTSSYGKYQYNSISGTIPTTDKNSGTYAALIRTVGWGNANTAGGAASICYNTDQGYLYLGTYDESTQSPAYGYAFASRPSALKFYYKYAPSSGDKLLAEIVVENRSGNETVELGRGTFYDGTAQGNYIPKEVNVTYNEAYSHLKATHIYIVFKSGENGTFVEKPPFANLSTGKFVGSQLFIDDIELIY